MSDTPLDIHRQPFDSEIDILGEVRALRDFAALSTDWFWEQDAEFRFTRFFGFSPEKLQRAQSDFLGKRRWDMPIAGVTPEQLAEHIATYERHETFHDFEYQVVGEGETIQHYSVSGTPVLNERGEFVGYRGVGRNLTKLRCAEMAARESGRRQAQIVDGSPIPTFVIDTEHRITHWNQACANLTGREAGEMLGSKDAGRAFYPSPRFTLADFLVSGTTEQATADHYQKLDHSALIPDAFEAESFFPEMGPDGRWLHLTAAPLRNADGQLIGALETLQDITEQRRSQQFLEARVAERTAELSQQLHFLQQLIDAIPGPVFYKDAQLRYLGCNRAFEAFIGRPASELIGQTPRDISPAELAEKYMAADQVLIDQPGTQIYESEVRYANGEMHDVMFHKATFTESDGTVGGIVGLMLDISGRKRMEEGLRQAATVFENSTEGVTITSPDGLIMTVNRAFSEITGYEASEVIGRNITLLQSGYHSQDFYHEMWKEIVSHDRWHGEIWDKRKNGELYPAALSISAVRDNAGRLTHYVGTFSDITRKKQAEEEIQRLAFSDALTGLPNRRLLLDRLRHALAACARTNDHGALLFIDLDDFKDLNDTLGHDKGDQLLWQVAQRLVGRIRECDTVARLGGDEFVVVLDKLSESLPKAINQAESVGAEILAALNQPYMLEDYCHHSTPSIGVTIFGGQHNSVDDLLKQGDLAMYHAKRSGRNTVRFFDPEMQNAVAARLSMVADLRHGIEKEQFILFYQPQIDFYGHLMGAEVLLRWKHPQRGMVSPAEFIPLAEETGLILPLGLWIMETACNQLAAWAKRPETAHLTLAVNVSARQFRQYDFVEQVLAALDNNAIAPNKLKLELTESMLADNIEGIIGKMTALKARGVALSLDDFGTGYSSLSYLKRLPLDQLKIDQSFVRDVFTDLNDAAIARSIIMLAQNLGLEIIAEGVETEQQFSFLSRHGCHAFQGYLFSRPLPLDDFEKFMRRKTSRMPDGKEF